MAFEDNPLLQDAKRWSLDPEREFTREELLNRFSLADPKKRVNALHELRKAAMEDDMHLTKRAQLHGDFTFLKNAHFRLLRAGR